MGPEKVLQENFLPRLLSGKSTPPPNRRSSKYIASKEIWNGLTESRDARKGEIHQFVTCKWRADWCSNGRMSVFNCQSHPGCQRGEARQKNNRTQRMTWRYRDSFATKAPSKNGFSNAPNTRVPGWACEVPRLLVHYKSQNSLAI